MKIFINGRFLTQKLTGVQKFSFEICKQLCTIYDTKIIVLVPKQSRILIDYEKYFKVKRIGIFKGHFWEQISLPLYLNSIGKPLLLNLTNSSPALYKNKFITIHDLSVYVNSSWNRFYYRLFYKILIPIVLNKSIS